MIFEATGKIVTVCVRLMLGKLGVNEFTGPRQEIDVSYGFDFWFALKTLGCK